jgi:hypothetical protein
MCPLYPATATSFKLDNVNASISNAIARVIKCEMVVKILDCDLSDIDTNDEFIIHHMIQSRVRMIPLQQSCKLGSKFTLDVTNSSLELIDVKSSLLTGAFVAFNQNITLFTLGANKSCKLTCRVIEASGNREGYGAACIGVNTVSIPQDMKECDKSTSRSNTTAWMIKFVNNGTAKSTNIIKDAVQNIIDRLQNIHCEWFTEDDASVAYIDDETDTIGAMLLKQIIIQNPQIEYVTIDSTLSTALKVRMVSSDPNKVMTEAVGSLKALFASIY